MTLRPKPEPVQVVKQRRDNALRRLVEGGPYIGFLGIQFDRRGEVRCVTDESRLVMQPHLRQHLARLHRHAGQDQSDAAASAAGKELRQRRGAGTCTGCSGTARSSAPSPEPPGWDNGIAPCTKPCRQACPLSRPWPIAPGR